MLSNARKKIAVLAMVAALVLQGCTALGVAETPAQKYYAAKGVYSTALAAVVVWAQGPIGQRHPEVILRVKAVDVRVTGTLVDIDVSMCYFGLPTADDPAPPPDPSCIPLVGAAAEEKFAFASQILLASAAEIRRLHPDLN